MSRFSGTRLIAVLCKFGSDSRKRGYTSLSRDAEFRSTERGKDILLPSD